MGGKLTVEIRAATAEDVLSISALAIHVFLDTYATEGIRPDLAREVFSEYCAEVFLSHLTSLNSVEIYFTEIDGHIIGFAEIDCAAKCPVVGMDGGVEIAKLYVQPKFHSQGVGKALLGSVEQRARDLDLTQIWLTAWTGNLNAIGFYDHCGFSSIGRVNFNIEDQNYENRLFVIVFYLTEWLNIPRTRSACRNGGLFAFCGGGNFEAYCSEVVPAKSQA